MSFAITEAKKALALNEVPVGAIVLKIIKSLELVLIPLLEINQ